jgi:hypothetical protein
MPVTLSPARLSVATPQYRLGFRYSKSGIHVRVGSKPVLTFLKLDFRSTPNSGPRQSGPVGPVRAKGTEVADLYRVLLFGLTLGECNSI